MDSSAHQNEPVMVPEIAEHTLVTKLLEMSESLLAVLDHERRVIAFNQQLLAKFKIKDPERQLSLRMGEIFQCRYLDPEKGCGNGPYCETCGAAIAIGLAAQSEEPVERICALSVENRESGEEKDFSLRVRCVMFQDEDRHYFLVFLQDITRQELWFTFERFFFHDFTNLCTGLISTGELLSFRYPQDPWVQRLNNLLNHLMSELQMQRRFVQDGSGNFTPSFAPVDVKKLIGTIKKLYGPRCRQEKKTLTCRILSEVDSFVSDETILLRILTNLLTNALEASRSGEEIRLEVEKQNDKLVFSVRNQAEIPEPVKRRIFQRHFSTKPGEGRGLGLFSSKVFAREFLQATLSYHSTPAEGTRFSLSVPLGLKPSG
ncbi:MAG: sensor histidine kinase [Lentisphaerae bacterium]|nr:MAG: sensor histidine kinase [Lentisphaerota bacterium]